MPASINKATILGNLGADPDIRELPEGGRVANLSIATSERWKDRESGEHRERTDWHRVTIFSEPLIALVEKALHKGSKVHIEGSLQTRKWVDRQNVERYSTEIVIRPISGTLTLLDAPKQTPAAAPTRSAPRNRRRDPEGPQAA